MTPTAAKLRLAGATTVALASVVIAARTVATAGSSMQDIWNVFVGVPIVVGFGIGSALVIAGRAIRYALLAPLPLFLLLLGSLALDDRNLGSGNDQLVVLMMTTVGTLLGVAPAAALGTALRSRAVQRKGAARGGP